MRKLFPAYAILFMALFVAACNGNGGLVTAPTDLREQDAVPSSQQILLGLYDITIDPLTEAVDVVPLRGADFQINLVKFLQPPAGSATNLGVKLIPGGSDISKGIIDLEVSITHPFPGTNLRGFDVRGIVIGKGTQLSQFDYDVQYAKPDELRLLNADGYTRWWNPVEFLTPGLFGYTPTMLGSGNPKATVNGFKYFADDLASDDPFDPDTNTRGTFSTQDPGGGSNKLTREYLLRFPMSGGAPVLTYRYAISASWLAPEAGSIPPAPVEDYPIEANCPEPYSISVSVDPTSTAFYNSAQAGGDLVLNLEISDWQTLVNPEGVPGEIGEVRFESPTMWTGLFDPFFKGVPIPASDNTSSAWRCELKNMKPTGQVQDIFITVQSADPTSYAPPSPGLGIYPGGAVLSAYQLVTLTLPENSAPKIGTITGPGKYAAGAQLEYSLSSMSDIQDGTNLTVTWDFDGDLDFDDDEDGIDTNMKGKITFTGDGTFYAQCRVTDTAGAHTDSNVLEVTPISLPYIDPMDTSTQTLWTIENGLFGYHGAMLQWNMQTDHWASGSSSTGFYEPYMDTTLISPEIPAGNKDKVTITLNHRYQTDYYWSYDYCQPYYRLNGGSWYSVGWQYYDQNAGYPSYVNDVFSISGLSPGDLIQLGFNFHSDDWQELKGWDITNLTMIDNEPPEIQGIYGPQSVDTLGPWAYSTVATDLDGISSYMWSVEAEGELPVYDDPGDGMGGLDAIFPADGNYDIWVEVTDAGDPPMPSEFGPYGVTVFSTDPDAFFTRDFETNTGDWTYTGGVDDGSYQDFWNIDTVQGWLTDVGPDGCYSETSQPPIEKTASVQVTFPNSTTEARMKIVHKLWVDWGGPLAAPWDGQWVTIDGNVVAPSYGFLYDDNGGAWSHGYFLGLTGGPVVSTFVLDDTYNDGLQHTLTFHQLSYDTATNCAPMEGWQIDYLEFWLND